MKILTVFFLLINFFSFAQNIKGVVLDKNTNKLLIGAHVYLKNSVNGNITNKKGEFHLKIKSKESKNDSLIISHIGYTTTKIPLSKIKESNYVIHLSPNLQNLEKVTVFSNKKLKPRIHFNKLKPLKKGLYSFGSLMINNKIYVIGGNASHITDYVLKTLSMVDPKPNLSILDLVNKARYNFLFQHFSSDLSIYNTATNTWKTSNLKFRNRAYNNIHFFNDKIYVLGGIKLSKSKKFEYLDDKIEVFDIKNDTILIDNANPHQAVNFASFLKNDNLIIIGGSTEIKKNGFKEYSNKIHLYNLKSGYWYELADMPTSKETKGVIVNDKIYLIGGYNKKPLEDIESIDLNTGKWKKEGQLFYGIDRPALTYNNNIIYIFENGKILTYNIITKELNEYLIDLFFKFSELYYTNNMLYLLGGYKENEYSLTASRGFYSINLNEFEITKINKSKTLKN